MLMKAFPNPFSNQCTLVLKLKHPTEVKAQLFDLRGRLAFQQTAVVPLAGEHHLKLHPLDLDEGTYILRLQTSEGISSNMLNYRP